MIAGSRLLRETHWPRPAQALWRRSLALAQGDPRDDARPTLATQAIGATQWQSLGNLPNGNRYVYPVSDSQGDVLWVGPATPFPGSGTPVPPLTGVVYSATPP